ncbi:hypothetical protein O181_092584 [Austropuccinia psidii MF-1]|uniref:Uncharacterized protein n=1 Tax=Austropuccinia psidii MF-1 TaxID=1389203 RepID=A0A9Q3IZJ6_9BASI|nr:hypothetical protein [Austropuccinia psidii MF-1]
MTISALIVFLPILVTLLYNLLAQLVLKYSLMALPSRNLRGKTIIIFAPSLTSLALKIIQHLSKDLVQLIVVLPAPLTDPINLQMIFLLRQPHNEQIFLEHCLVHSPDDVIRFTRQWLCTTQIATHSSRLDTLLFLHHPQTPQIFLLLNVLLPFLLKQQETGPPLRVIPLNSRSEFSSLWRTFQHHLEPNPPLILIPSSSASPLDALWAIFAPLSALTPGLKHKGFKPEKAQEPIDPALLEKHLKLTESVIEAHMTNK